MKQYKNNLNPQSSVPSPQSSVLSPQSSVPSPQSSALSPQSSVPSPQSSVLSPQSSVFLAGHRGLVGSALMRRLTAEGYTNLITRTSKELDLTNQQAVADFFARERPEFVFLAAARAGGIHANNTYRAEFIYQNLMIQTNVMHQSYLNGVKKLLFLGSSCIYPRLCPQPMREEHLMTGPLEETNSPYALAKIAGIEMCWSYNRQYGTRFIPVMPTNLYGPGDNYNLNNSHVLPALIRKFHLAKMAKQGDLEAIRRDEKRFGRIPADIKEAIGLASDSSRLTSPASRVVIWGSGSPMREFLYVDDLADACLFVMNLDDLSSVAEGQPASLPACKLASQKKYDGGRHRNTEAQGFSKTTVLSPQSTVLSPQSPVLSPDSSLLTPHSSHLSRLPSPVSPLLNIGTGREITIHDLALLVREIVGFEGDLVFDATKPDGTPRKMLDVSRMTGLGWQARTGFRAGIAKAYGWYLDEVG